MRTTLVLALGTVLLAACGQNPPPPPAAATPAPEAAAPAATDGTATPAAPVAAVSPEGRLWFEPAGLSACAKERQKVMVFWDARTLPGSGPIELRAAGAEGKELMFARAARVGKKETGPWMKAGSEILMRSLDGTELVRASVQVIPCP